MPDRAVAKICQCGLRELLLGRLQFLQADDVGTVALHPFAKLDLASAYAVDVPGRYLQSGLGRPQRFLCFRLNRLFGFDEFGP